MLKSYLVLWAHQNFNLIFQNGLHDLGNHVASQRVEHFDKSLADDINNGVEQFNFTVNVDLSWSNKY